jgi:hypothetical protein
MELSMTYGDSKENELNQATINIKGEEKLSALRNISTLLHRTGSAKQILTFSVHQSQICGTAWIGQ